MELKSDRVELSTISDALQKHAGDGEPDAVTADGYYSDPAREQRINLLLHLIHYADLLLLSSAKGSGKTSLLANFVERMELIFVAQLHTAFPAPDPLPENTVITVAVDEKSIDALGQWPWPRSYYVKLIQKLREAGAKAIAFHIVFADPDRMGEHHDQQLAHEIKKGKVILGWLGEGLSVTDNGEPKTYSDKLVMFNNLFESNINKDIFSFVIKTNAPIRNVDVIEESANGAGLLGMMLGSDGMTREVPLLVNSRLKLQPTFFTEVARVSQGQEQTFLETTSIGLKAVHISGDLVVPTNESGAIVLKYRPYNLKNTVSALDVMFLRVRLSCWAPQHRE